MKYVFLTFLTLCLAGSFAAGKAMAAGDMAQPKQVDWAFDGMTGTVDRAAAQRGLQVYREVCASCHGLDLVAFRTLTHLGFSADEVKQIASEASVQDGPNDDGEMFERPGTPADKFQSPYPNEKAARSVNNGAFPPDLSLMVKARPDGGNYLYSLLTGYENSKQYRCLESYEGACVRFEAVGEVETVVEPAPDSSDEAMEADETAEADEEAEEAQEEATPMLAEMAPKDVTGTTYLCASISHVEMQIDGVTKTVETCNEMGAAMHYNPYFPGRQIAMPPPLFDGAVSYGDDTEASVEQMAHDVTVFLQWAAEPEMEHRKAMGIKVLIFLAIMTILFYISKKRIWARLQH